MKNQFEIYDIDSAPEDSRETLSNAQSNFGMVPNLYGVLAESPAAVKAYSALGQLFIGSSLTPAERHVVWFTINAYHDCQYCMAGHTGMAKGEKISDSIIESARNVSQYDDEKLEALRVFTLKLVEQRGWVSEEDVKAFIETGYTHENILDILVGISHKVLSNYTNHLAQTPVDDAFKSFAWQKPE